MPLIGDTQFGAAQASRSDQLLLCNQSKELNYFFYKYTKCTLFEISNIIMEYDKNIFYFYPLCSTCFHKKITLLYMLQNTLGEKKRENNKFLIKYCTAKNSIPEANLRIPFRQTMRRKGDFAHCVCAHLEREHFCFCNFLAPQMPGR